MIERNSDKISIVVLVLAIIVVLLVGSMFGLISSSDNSQPKTITTNGMSVVRVSPDTAYINIGVVTEGEEAATAQKDAGEKMNAVMAELKNLGIEEQDIRTINYSVNPKYVWNPNTGENTMVGYTVNNTVEVKVSDLDKLGTIVDSVTEGGSNQIHGIRFELQDKSVAYKQAREFAIKDAKTKAEAYAVGLGIKSIYPVKVTEGYNSGDRYEVYSVEEVKDSVATPINPGQITITVNVTVDFSF